MPTSQETREIELKYRVDDGAALDRLRRAGGQLAGYALGPLSTRATLDVYWDSSDFALTRSGFGLRLRRQDDIWQVTLKELSVGVTSALADRIEIERTLTTPQIDDFLRAPKLARLLAMLAPNAEMPTAWTRVLLHKKNPRLRPLVTVRQSRDKRDLVSPRGDAAPVAELSLDSVSVLRPLDSYPCSESLLDMASPTGQFLEVEIEGQRGQTADVLQKIDQTIGRKRGFQPSSEGKAEAALRLIESVAAIQGQTSMAEAGRQIWRRQFVEILLNEYAIRARTETAVDAVHDMRVAIRRIRAAERIFGAAYTPKVLRPYLRRLRDLARALGKARDLDVSLALVEQYSAALDTQSHPLGLLRQRWQEERDAAYAELQKILSRRDHSRFIGDFGRFCHTPGLGVDPAKAAAQEDELASAAQEIRHVMPGEILLHYANMRVYEGVIQAETPPAIFHALRIEGKRLRYALEFVQHLLDPKPAQALIDKLKQVQECLGNLNDAAVMQDRLRQFASEQPQAPSVVPVLDYLDTQIAAEKSRFVALWADFVSPATRRQLAIAVAAL